MAAHRTATMHKFRYRAVLDTKKSRGLLPAVGMLVANPASFAFIASETIAPRHRPFVARLAWATPAVATEGSQIRLLLGLPQSRLSVVVPRLSDA